MPVSRTSKRKTEHQSGEERKYPTAKLLRSQHLSAYQPDFAKAILAEPLYSVPEAKAILDQELGGK